MYFRLIYTLTSCAQRVWHLERLVSSPCLAVPGRKSFGMETEKNANECGCNLRIGCAAQGSQSFAQDKGNLWLHAAQGVDPEVGTTVPAHMRCSKWRVRRSCF
jgi:hypothetical protein